MSLGFVRSFVVLFASFLLTSGMLHTELIGDFIDVSEELKKLVQTVFVGGDVVTFDTATGYGKLRWDRYKQTNPIYQQARSNLGSGRVAGLRFFARIIDQLVRIA